MFAPMALDLEPQWCPICGHDVRANDDGTIARHPARYADMVAYLAAVVTTLERGWWEPIWTRPMRRS